MSEEIRMHNHPSQLILLEKYNPGLLGGFDCWNTELWHNYIRDELSRAHEWYEAQVQGV